MAPSPKILLVEDDPDIRRNISFLLNTSGFDVTLATNGLEGLECAGREHFDLVITDLMMPFMDGNHLIVELSKFLNPPPVIVMTGTITAIHPNPLIKIMVLKPFPLRDFIRQLEFVLEHYPTKPGYRLDQAPTSQ